MLPLDPSGPAEAEPGLGAVGATGSGLGQVLAKGPGWAS